MQTVNGNRKLKFNLLGPPTVTYQGQILDIPRRQVRTLLYLLAGQNQPIPYQTIHYLFWSDKPETICRRNLSHLFTHIRNILPDNKILIQSSVSANLDPDLVWSDVIEFHQLCSRSCVEENLPEFIQAHQLYRGAYLEGKYLPKSSELDKYIDQKRLSLELLFMKNLSNLIILNKNLKNYLKAIEYAEEYLNLDSYNEDILGQMLILHSLMGNNSKVIQQYNSFAKHLKEDLNINPSPKTQKLFQQISTTISDEINPSFSPDSIAREQFFPFKEYHSSNLKSLQKIMNRKNGFGGIALLIGEIGMGKSELITQYMSQDQPNQVNFRVACTPATQNIRFYPFRELANKLISTKDQDPLNLHLVSSNLSNIATQLSKPVQIQSTLTDNVIEIILERDFSLIQELFQELVKLPLAIVISVENLEWIDNDSLEMILFLSEKFDNQHITFICSFCCKKEDKLKVFEQHLQLSPAHLGTIHMEDLKHDDVKIMLEELFGSFPKSRQISKQFVQLTGGNQFYICEILEWMKVNKWSAKKLALIQNFEIPNTVKQKIIGRFERLSNNEKEILQYAAVKGSSISFYEIRDLIKLSNHQTLEAVDDLICRNLLGHEKDTYFIKYEIVRQSILFNMSSIQKQMFGRILKESITD